MGLKIKSVALLVSELVRDQDPPLFVLLYTPLVVLASNTAELFGSMIILPTVTFPIPEVI